STTISVLLIQIAVISVLTSKFIESEIKRNFFVNVFLDEGLSFNSVKEISEILTKSGYTKSIKFISKEDAREKFILETGEDFSRILKNNPLPASFVITLKESTFDSNKVKSAISNFESLDGVESVYFESTLFERALNIIKLSEKYLWLLVSVFSFLSFYIVYSTLRLILENQSDEIYTMKLVGASVWMIRAPIILSGIIIGLLSSIVSDGIIFGSQKLMSSFFSFVAFSNFIRFELLLLIGLIVGPMIGFMCSIFVTKKIKINQT
ncbi:MAG TPA: permease-like cell division protein FtsX, partial [Ignavibacteriaceae bacterium]|nr:permease-like cell division protein FtsX [Ignavibacteriaceae bacterium]